MHTKAFDALPAELSLESIWTPHTARRPVAKPGDLSRCTSLADALSDAAQHGADGVGISFAKGSSLSCIDIDYNGDKEGKRALTAAAQAFLLEHSIQPSSELFAEWLLDQPHMHLVQALPLGALMRATYTEVSFSLTGLHLLLHVWDKDSMTQAYVKSTHPDYAGQWSFYNSYMTCTGYKLYSSPGQLAMTSVHSLPTLFARRAEAAPASQTESIEDVYASIRLATIDAALQLLPMTQTSELRKQWRALTGQTYEHYSYWLTIGMALHHYGASTNQLVDMFQLYLEWSRKDAVSYKDDKDVEDHWVSFDERKQQTQLITVKTLIKLSSMLSFQYPKPIWKDGKPTKYPENNEYDNFAYLAERFNMQLYTDQGGAFYLKGEPDMMKRFFMFPNIAEPVLDKFYGPYTDDMLTSATTRLCQAHNWRKLQSTKLLTQLWKPSAQPLDLFAEWLNTPFNELPERYATIRTTKGLMDADKYTEQSTIDYIYDCLSINYQHQNTTQTEEQDLYHACLEKTLLHIIKYREEEIVNSYRNDSGGMLILVGAEHTYKSTFCKMLLPLGLQFLRKEVNQQINNTKAERDFIRYLGSRAIVQLDEFEGMMNMKTHSSFFKNLLSSDSMNQVDIYSTTETPLQRKAIIIATTNEVKHVLSREGSRRLWFIPTGTIDTNRMLLFNHHAFYTSMRERLRFEYKQGRAIWQLTKEQSALRSNWNEGYAASSSLATVMEDIWPFMTTTMPKDYLKNVNINKSGTRELKCMSTLEVQTILQEAGLRINTAQLKHELQRYCSMWTNTGKEDKLVSRTITVIKGKACQNWYEPRKRYQYEYWVMPPRTKSLSAEFYAESDVTENEE